jgi:hypothetical protein
MICNIKIKKVASVNAIFLVDKETGRQVNKLNSKELDDKSDDGNSNSSTCQLVNLSTSHIEY